MDLEHVGEVDEINAAEETQLTEEQIENIAAEFGQHATTAQELFKMKRQMSHDDFRGWVNVAGNLQMLQNALPTELLRRVALYGSKPLFRNICKQLALVNVATTQACLWHLIKNRPYGDTQDRQL